MRYILNGRTLVVLLLIVAGAAAGCTPKPILPRPYMNDFWRNLAWQRYDKLKMYVVDDRQKDLKDWVGVDKKPEMRVMETQMESLEMPGEATAQVTIFMRYFKEAEYVEQSTEVTQIWIRDDIGWKLKEGFPLDH